MDSIYLAPIINLVAFLAVYFSYWQTDDEQLFNYSIFAWIFFILHFGVHSELNPMISCSFILLKVIVAKDNYRNYLYMTGFILLSLLQTVFISEQLNDIFPIAASIVSTIAFFCFRGIVLRALLAVSSILMLINFYLLGMNISVFAELIGIVILVVTITKLKGDKTNIVKA